MEKNVEHRKVVKCIYSIADGTDMVKKELTEIAEHPALQLAALAIPIVGQYASSILSIWVNDRQQRRLHELFILMKEEMEKLEKTRVDFRYLKSEQFADLMMQIAVESIKSRYREKMQVFCQIMSGAVVFEGKKYRQYCEDYVYVVSDLTPADMTVAAEIFRQQEGMPKVFPKSNPKINELSAAKERGWDTITRKCNLNATRFQLSLVKLERAGLIHELVGYLDNAGRGFMS